MNNNLSYKIISEIAFNIDKIKTCIAFEAKEKRIYSYARLFSSLLPKSTERSKFLNTFNFYF